MRAERIAWLDALLAGLGLVGKVRRGGALFASNLTDFSKANESNEREE